MAFPFNTQFKRRLLGTIASVLVTWESAKYMARKGSRDRFRGILASVREMNASFIGRESEVKDYECEFNGTPSLIRIICGPLNVGKTQLVSMALQNRPNVLQISGRLIGDRPNQQEKAVDVNCALIYIQFAYDYTQILKFLLGFPGILCQTNFCCG